MTPHVGDRVHFKEHGTSRIGIVAEVFTAGQPGGVGIKRQRQRVRLSFDSDGQQFETNRDVDEITPVGAEQGSLFEAERL